MPDSQSGAREEQRCVIETVSVGGVRVIPKGITTNYKILGFSWSVCLVCVSVGVRM